MALTGRLRAEAAMNDAREAALHETKPAKTFHRTGKRLEKARRRSRAVRRTAMSMTHREIERARYTLAFQRAEGDALAGRQSQPRRPAARRPRPHDAGGARRCMIRWPRNVWTRFVIADDQTSAELDRRDREQRLRNGRLP
jgi:hypothetical protein